MRQKLDRLGRSALLAACGVLFAGGVVVVNGQLAAGSAADGPDAAGVTWVCSPSLAGDPCLYPESADSVAANGAKTVVPASAASPPRIRLLLRLSHRHRVRGDVEHRDGGHSCS